MIGFTKSHSGNLLAKQVSTGKQGDIDTDEIIQFGRGRNASGDNEYARKIAISGLTFEQMHRMYVANVWVRAIVDKTVERSVDIAPLIKPVKLSMEDSTKESPSGIPKETQKHIEEVWEMLINPNELEESFNDVRKKITRDLLQYDAGAFEIVKGKKLSNGESSSLVEIYSLPGNTIKLNVNRKGEFRSKAEAYVQMVRGREKVATFTRNECAYLVMNPQSDRVYGLSPLESLVQTVTADLYASQYNTDFFYNNATPRFAVLMEGVGQGQGNAALERFRTWWDQELKGNPHRPIVIGTESGSVKFQQVGLTNEEMQFQEYSRWLLMKIMAVYRMQPMVLGVVDSNTGKLNSVEQTRLYKQDAIKPLLTLFSEKMNSKVIFSKGGYGYKDVYLDFDLDLVDKADQAKWHQIYLQTGVLTINEIRTQGLGMVPVPWGNVPYLQNNLVPFGMSADGTSAVPITPEQAIVQHPSETTATPAGVVSRSAWGNYIQTYRGDPVGWEDLPLTDRLEVVEKMIKLKEQQLSKVYILPKDVLVK